MVESSYRKAVESVVQHMCQHLSMTGTNVSQELRVALFNQQWADFLLFEDEVELAAQEEMKVCQERDEVERVHEHRALVAENMADELEREKEIEREHKWTQQVRLRK